MRDEGRATQSPAELGPRERQNALDGLKLRGHQHVTRNTFAKRCSQYAPEVRRSWQALLRGATNKN
eukprot:14790877-Alexandrium_andersonii.AAC.2